MSSITLSLRAAALNQGDDGQEAELLSRSLSIWGGAVEAVCIDVYTAASVGSYDRIRDLIQRGDFDMNKPNCGGWTALMYASYIGHDSIVSLLLDARVEVNMCNNLGQTPLMLASSCGNDSVAYFLLQHNAKLEALDKRGWSALYHATYSGHQNIVKFLLDNRANTDIVEPSRGYTPFMRAAADGNEMIVQLFIEYNVNIMICTKSGESARSLAYVNGHLKIVNMIDNQLAKLSGGAPLRQDAGLEGFGLDHLHRGPSISDGPQALDKLMKESNKQKLQQQSSEPFNSSLGGGSVRCTDFVSPINTEDHRLSSSEQDSSDKEYDDNFSRTDALTIVSPASSGHNVGGLLGAMGLQRPIVGAHSNTRAHTNAHSHTPISASSTDDEDEHFRQRPRYVRSNSRGSSQRGQHNNLSTGQHHEQQHHQTQTTMGHKMMDNGSYEGQGHHVQAANPRAITGYSHQQQQLPPGYQHPSGPPSMVPSAAPAARCPPGFQGPSLPVQPTATLHPQSNRPSATHSDTSRPKNLSELLHQIGVSKYLKTFEDEDVDLQVFLSLTDNDLKEVGINLFGPRRKMTSAIARWHSNSSMSSELEHAYCDKLETEMQELALQLTKTAADLERTGHQLDQERQARTTLERSLNETLLACRHISSIVADTTSNCDIAANIVDALLRSSESSSPIQPRPASFTSTEDTSLVSAIQEGLSLSPTHGADQHLDPRQLRDAKAYLAIISMNVSKLAHVTKSLGHGNFSGQQDAQFS